MLIQNFVVTCALRDKRFWIYSDSSPLYQRLGMDTSRCKQNPPLDCPLWKTSCTHCCSRPQLIDSPILDSPEVFYNGTTSS